MNNTTNSINKSSKAIILAAGFGKRLLPLTKDKPKAMIEIANKPLIHHTINWLTKNKIKDLAINLHYKPQIIVDYLGCGSRFNCNITYSKEKEILGTAGAVKKLKNYFDKDFFVIYGDTYTNLNLQKVIEFHRRNNAFMTIVIRKKENSKRKSNIIELNKYNQIIKYIEKPKKDEDQNLDQNINYANCGIYFCNNNVTKYIPDGFSDFSYDVIPNLIKKEKIFAYVLDNKTYYAELGRLEKFEKYKKEIENIILTQ
jgi:NDP-sugar pyrophosphorylase family protein